MVAAIDVLGPAHPRRVLLIASNPTVSSLGFVNSPEHARQYSGAAVARLIVEALGR